MSTDGVYDSLSSVFDPPNTMRDEQFEQIADLELQDSHSSEEQPPLDSDIVQMKYEFDQLADSLHHSRLQSHYSSEPELGRLLSRLTTDPSKEDVSTNAGAISDSYRESYSYIDSSRRMGKYRLTGILGEGGMGTVFSAENIKNGQQVALKTYRRDGSPDQKISQRFEREIQAVQQLDDPHIVGLLDYKVRHVQSYFVTELISGMSSSHIAKSVGKIGIPEACEIVRQTALGVAALHQAGIIHRDIKPGNLMVTPDGNVIIIDFGLAFLPDMRNDELTQTGQGLGTFDYMAPEQIMNARAVDEKADLYSLGATLYKLLSGVSPHGSRELTHPVQKLHAISHETIRDIRELRPDLSESLSELINTLLSRDAQQRSLTAVEVADDLLPFCDGHSLANVVKSIPPLRIKPIPESRESHRALQLRKQLRHTRFIMGLISFITLGLACLAWAIWPPDVFLSTNTPTTQPEETAFPNLKGTDQLWKRENSSANLDVASHEARPSSIPQQVEEKSTTGPTGYLPEQAFMILKPTEDYDQILASQLAVASETTSGNPSPTIVSLQHDSSQTYRSRKGVLTYYQGGDARTCHVTFPPSGQCNFYFLEWRYDLH